MLKLCPVCKLEKDISLFSINNRSKDKLHYYCKECSNRKNRESFLKNKDEINKKHKSFYIKNKEKILKKHKEYYHNNKEKFRILNKKWIENNKEKYNKYSKLYREQNTKHIKEYHRKKYLEKRYGIKKPYKVKYNKEDLKLIQNLRIRIRKALVRNSKAGHTLELINCSIENLKTYLQQTAIHNGYKDFNINNYSGKEYHIDHIIPCAVFNLKCSYHQRLCFNWQNLQILKAEENLSKGDKIEF